MHGLTAMDDSFDASQLDLDRPAFEPSHRLSLSSLPPEIKARVCELAHLQDQRFKQRKQVGTPEEDLTRAVKTDWHGRSLSALSQTCWDFNSLANKWSFFVSAGDLARHGEGADSGFPTDHYGSQTRFDLLQSQDSTSPRSSRPRRKPESSARDGQRYPPTRSRRPPPLLQPLPTLSQ